MDEVPKYHGLWLRWTQSTVVVAELLSKTFYKLDI